MNHSAQTATEYLVILGVVIVIGLITVTTLTDITGFGDGTDERTARLAMQTLDVSILNYVLTPVYVQTEMANKHDSSIEIVNITYDGKKAKCVEVHDLVWEKLNPYLFWLMRMKHKLKMPFKFRTVKSHQMRFIQKT